MNPKLLLADVLCLCLFASTGYAQTTTWSEHQRFPEHQQEFKFGLTNVLRSQWDRGNAYLWHTGLLVDPDVRNALDISQEQLVQIQEHRRSAFDEWFSSPESQTEQRQIDEALQTIKTSGYDSDEGLKARMKILEIQAKSEPLGTKIVSNTMDAVLTPEQKQKMNEIQLTSMGKMPIIVATVTPTLYSTDVTMPVISPHMFEALDLTDAQKRQMERIKKELEPEFEKTLADFVNNQVILRNRMIDEFEKQGENNVFDYRGAQEAIPPLMKKLLAEDPEYKKIHDEMQSKTQTFAARYKTKMFDALTDLQWKRLQELIDNPPAHAKAFRNRLKEKMGEAEKSGGGWQPGPNSWRPGDAIPEEYRRQRNVTGPFPTSEEEE
jgi:Spy/CpxP family protein refolding chaperone/Ni/Co efflux regulator RcnB